MMDLETEIELEGLLLEVKTGLNAKKARLLCVEQQIGAVHGAVCRVVSNVHLLSTSITTQRDAQVIDLVIYGRSNRLLDSSLRLLADLEKELVEYKNETMLLKEAIGAMECQVTILSDEQRSA